MIETVTAELADEVVTHLRTIEAELRRRGIVELSLFGSVARGEAHAGSDVDLAVVVDPRSRRGWGFGGVEELLEGVLGRPVDILTLPIRNPYIKAAVERDLRRVF